MNDPNSKRSPADGVTACPESGKHCRWVEGECQTCGVVALPGDVAWCGQCDRPAAACAKEGAHRPSGVMAWHQRYCDATSSACMEGCAAGPCKRAAGVKEGHRG